VANKPDDGFYRALFLVAPSVATAPMASEPQSRFVKALIDRIESDAPYESLRGRATTFKQCQTELDQTLEQREALRTPELCAAADLQAALESANRSYNKLYPRLSPLFDSKSFIDTFFAEVHKTDKADTELPEEQPAAAMA